MSGISANVRCAHCGKRVRKQTGAINRARAEGRRLFCNRRCSGLGRRKGKTKVQKREEKRLYDMQYRGLNRDVLRAKKAAYHRRTYDPAKAAVERKANMARHVEYCRQPVYKAYKSDYDKAYRAKRYFGPFWESALLAAQIENEVLARASRYDIALGNGTLNKAQQRRRQYESANGYKP